MQVQPQPLEEGQLATTHCRLVLVLVLYSVRLMTNGKFNAHSCAPMIGEKKSYPIPLRTQDSGNQRYFRMPRRREVEVAEVASPSAFERLR